MRDLNAHVVQGLVKSGNELSRGDRAEDIVSTVTLSMRVTAL
jgi:phosphotransacetylase